MDISRANPSIRSEIRIKDKDKDMSGLLLTREDRIRFAEYLTREAESTEVIVKQMETVGMSSAIIEAVIEKYRTEIRACRVVAALLLKTQDG